MSEEQLKKLEYDFCTEFMDGSYRPAILQMAKWWVEKIKELQKHE